MAWSPDGAQVSYIDGQGALIGVNAATGVQKVLVNHDKMQAFLRSRSIGAGLGAPRALPRAQLHLDAGLQASALRLEWTALALRFDFRRGSADGIDSRRKRRQPAILSRRQHNFLLFGITISTYSGRQQSALPFRLTQSSTRTLLNGEVDWVYEEELDVRSNYFWSPDSKHLAYLQSDES